MRIAPSQANGDAQMGIHNFETVVRMEVHDKLERTLGRSGSFQWPPIVNLLFFLGYGACR